MMAVGVGKNAHSSLSCEKYDDGSLPQTMFKGREQPLFVVLLVWGDGFDWSSCGIRPSNSQTRQRGRHTVLMATVVQIVVR